MALSASPVLRSDARADAPLPGAALQVLCGLAWLGVAWAFSFLDRAHDRFGFFAIAWLVAGAFGFGLGVLHRRRPRDARRAAAALSIVAGVLALFPGFLMFTLVRWLAFALLLMTAARAAGMQTRRDLYYALASIDAVSLLVLTHANAHWTIWFYLAPAWVCVALALAWDYAAAVRLHASVKVGLTGGFLALCIALGLAVAALLPLPQAKGWGFLEPATDNPGRKRLPAGGAGGTQGNASRQGAGQEGTQGAGSSRQGGEATLLGDAIERLHEAMRDRGLPQWQRGLVEGMLTMAEATARIGGHGDGRLAGRPLSAQEREELERRAAAFAQALQQALNLFLTLLLLLLLWLLRWRLAGALAMGGAWLLAPWSAAASMRCSILGLRLLLRRHGHALQPGQSVLEHVESAAFLPDRVRAWLRRAVHTYGAVRFGGMAASPAGAALVRQSVVATEEVLRTRKH